MHETPASNIVLIGPMGAGKTTVGRLLADALGKHFVDTDNEIERRTGASIAWIFEKEGETGFRTRESHIVAHVMQQASQVVATGGGVVMSDSNRTILSQNAVVIYLYAPVSMQLTRTSKDKNRPLLRTQDPEAKLTQLFTLRDPLYRSIAHYIVPTSDGSARELTQKIIHLLGLKAVK